MKNKGARNEQVVQAIALLEKTGRKEKVALWKDIATRLQKPRRKRISTNIWKINKENEKGEKKFLLVPGKVLSFGQLSKPVNVIALEFSEAAKKKIGDKGRALTIIEALNEKVKPSEIVIVC